MLGRVLLFLLCAQWLGAERYALILSDAPAIRGSQLRIKAAQTRVRGELARRGMAVTGSVERILNAVFVSAQPADLDELRGLPGVAGVVPVPRLRLKLNRAVELVNAPAAWQALGGTGNAGAGVKIAVIDTGIDQNHPAFQDRSLAAPAGFPLCAGDDCAFTNGKVIVARSYIREVAAGTLPAPAVDSRPDDFSPRDHVGHGTAVAMIAGGATNTGPAATITGMAPKAWLGNYKVFGSPGINDGTTSDVVLRALEDALNDGMDVAVLSLGGPALAGPLDTGADCGRPPNVPCDLISAGVENAAQAGIVVVAAAGNEGDTGTHIPTLNTVDAPALTPSVIAAGATTNAHVFLNRVLVPGEGVPENLRQIPAVFGDGPIPDRALTAPLVDVAALGDNGLACDPLPLGSLEGAFALIQRGVCTFAEKVRNAQNAGAVGAVIYQQDGAQELFGPGGLLTTRIPAVMIGFEDGRALKAFIAANPRREVTLDTGLAEAGTRAFNQVSEFSSRGPALGNTSLKPDIVATGTEIYTATQSFDPDGVMYDPSGYTVTQGTSFSAPVVAGGVALVKQRHPEFTPAQLRSAVINTAAQDVTEAGRAAGVTAVGAGKLDAGAAVRTPLTIEPATLAFGVLTRSPDARQQLTIRNATDASVTVSLTVRPATADTTAVLRLDRESLTLAPRQSGAVTATLSGTLPAPGIYEGAVAVQGGGGTLRVPYLFVVGDGVPYNAIPLVGDAFADVPGEPVTILFKVTDRYGVGVPDLPVRFRVTRGGGTVRNADPQTDRYGIAGAEAVLGPLPGPQQFQAVAGGLTVTFDGVAVARPSIFGGGVVSAAGFDTRVAAGSYISIFGTGLSGSTRAATGTSLPVGLAGVSVSFDAPNGLSLPGRVYSVSPGQVNAQVPWELAGQRTAAIKVNRGGILSGVAQVQLFEYAPAVFEYAEAGGRRLAAALDENSRAVGTANAARRGRAVQVFCSGLGPVDKAPAPGQPASVSPLVRTMAAPVVTIGGRPAQVSFSGLAPGFAGVYQLNVTVPADAATGLQPLVVTAGGVAAKAVMLPVM